jgi:hypothetical protein
MGLHVGAVTYGYEQKSGYLVVLAHNDYVTVNNRAD